MSNVKFYWVLLGFALCSTAQAADNFVDAQVLNVEAKQALTSGGFGIFNTGLEDDDHIEVTVQIGDMKVIARSYTMAAGGVYIHNHPEAMIVGSTVKAQIAKSWLEVQVPPKGKVLKFKIQRMEKIS